MSTDERLRHLETMEQYLTGGANPNGVVNAAEGTAFWDNVNNDLYYNTDGVTAWQAIGGGSGGANDSVARSMATSAVTRADSQNTSQSGNVSTADSKAESAEDEAESLNTSQSTLISAADSRITSVAGGSGSTDSVARSMATSAASTADSQNTSQSTNVSVALSTATAAASTATSQNTSQSTNVSVALSTATAANSAALSAGTLASTASSAASIAQSAATSAGGLASTANSAASVALSTATSAGTLASTASSAASIATSMATSAVNRADSQAASLSVLVSTADSKAESAEDEAESMNTSQSTNVSVALSTATAAQSMATSAVTKADSQNTSQSTNVSVAASTGTTGQSMATSAVTKADSQNTSQSTNVSVALSTASSQNVSQSTNVSTALSTAASVGTAAVQGRGSGAASRVAYWSSADAITSDAGLTVDAANNGYVVADDGYTGITADVRIVYDSSSGFIKATLGDAAGADEFQIVDSGAGVVGSVDSDGRAYCATLLEVGAVLGLADRLGVANTTIDTTATYYGARMDFYKTAGATDQDDPFYGMFVRQDLNQAAGEVGYTHALAVEFNHEAGAIGDAVNTRYLRVTSYLADLNAGTIYGDATTARFYTDQEAAHTITGDAHACYIGADFDGTVTGTAYLLYLDQASGVDYVIYHDGAAPSVLGGNTMIGTTSNTGKLTVDQSSTTAAIPVLELDQADLSEEFINFIATVGAGNPIDATTALGAYYARARVQVQGVGYKYIALYDA